MLHAACNCVRGHVPPGGLLAQVPGLRLPRHLHSICSLSPSQSLSERAAPQLFLLSLQLPGSALRMGLAVCVRGSAQEPGPRDTPSLWDEPLPGCLRVPSPRRRKRDSCMLCPPPCSGLGYGRGVGALGARAPAARAALESNSAPASSLDPRPGTMNNRSPRLLCGHWRCF